MASAIASAASFTSFSSSSRSLAKYRLLRLVVHKIPLLPTLPKYFPAPGSREDTAPCDPYLPHFESHRSVYRNDFTLRVQISDGSVRLLQVERHDGIPFHPINEGSVDTLKALSALRF